MRRRGSRKMHIASQPGNPHAYNPYRMYPHPQMMQGITPTPPTSSMYHQSHHSQDERLNFQIRQKQFNRLKDELDKITLTVRMRGTRNLSLEQRVVFENDEFFVEFLRYYERKIWENAKPAKEIEAYMTKIKLFRENYLEKYFFDMYEALEPRLTKFISILGKKFDPKTAKSRMTEEAKMREKLETFSLQALNGWFHDHCKTIDKQIDEQEAAAYKKQVEDYKKFNLLKELQTMKKKLRRAGKLTLGAKFKEEKKKTLVNAVGYLDTLIEDEEGREKRLALEAELDEAERRAERMRELSSSKAKKKGAVKLKLGRLGGAKKKSKVESKISSKGVEELKQHIKRTKRVKKVEKVRESSRSSSRKHLKAERAKTKEITQQRPREAQEARKQAVRNKLASVQRSSSSKTAQPPSSSKPSRTHRTPTQGSKLKSRSKPSSSKSRLLKVMGSEKNVQNLLKVLKRFQKESIFCRLDKAHNGHDNSIKIRLKVKTGDGSDEVLVVKLTKVTSLLEDDEGEEEDQTGSILVSVDQWSLSTRGLKRLASKIRDLGFVKTVHKVVKIWLNNITIKKSKK